MHELIDRALLEDLDQAGDLTSLAVVDADAVARARIDQKAEGVVAGLGVAEAVFRRVDPAVSWHARCDQGEWRVGGLVAEVAGPARSILAAERVALNFLGRLSGVATLTARYVRAVDGTGARILDTRKTTPGLRALEKQAVLTGGGVSHRAGLHDAVLVKENHAVLAGGVGVATRRALAQASDRIAVVVECATLDDVDEALAAGAPRVLLDNMDPDAVRMAAERVVGRAQVEVSGGVTLEGVRALAEAGAELISVGALTHSAPALDLSLTLEPL